MNFHLNGKKKPTNQPKPKQQRKPHLLHDLPKEFFGFGNTVDLSFPEERALT